MNYSFYELIEDLNTGREIHFVFESETYYIGCGTGEFMFWKFYDSNSEVTGVDAGDLLRKVSFNGKSLKDIWHLVEIDTIF